MATKLLFESTSCGRCGGSGPYGPTCVYGGKCFKCCGRGMVLTKRGHAAQLYYASLREKPVEDIKAGDLVLYEGYTAGSLTVPNRWCVVTKDAYLNEKSGCFSGGVEHPRVMVETDYCNFQQAPGGTMIRGMTAEEKIEIKAKALAYQETLTKTGIPRKGARA